MPLYKWEDLELTDITPRHTVAKGKTILGDMIMLQTLEFRGNPPGDRRQGATLHNHPEEQFLIVKEGVFRMHEEGVNAEGEWTDLKPGDAYWIPAYSMHEMIVEGEGSFYQFKTRIPGHSVYDGVWDSDSESEWSKLTDKYSELRGKYKENVPWGKKE